MKRPDLEIHGSVGRHGRNHHDDVFLIQQLVNAHLPPAHRPLRVDGVCGPHTVAAIEAVQRHNLHLRPADGRVDPWGPTFVFLASQHRTAHLARPAHQTTPAAKSTAKSPTPSTSAASAASPQAVPNLRKPAGTARFPADIIGAAQTSQARWQIPAAITLAQWALESNWGKKMPPGSNNPFGIKARKNEASVEIWTHEVIHGKRILVKAKFAAFPSVDAAIDRHGELLATGRAYTAARARLPDADSFADGLTGTYATDPNYGTLLKRIMKSNNLYQYDQLQVQAP